MRFQKTKEASVTTKVADVGGELRRSYRRRTLRRYLILLAVVLVGFGISFADRCWINADGIVVGQLTPVNPISQVRIQKLRSKCLDYVSEGQVIADLQNDITMQAGTQQLQQLQIELAQANAQAEISAKEAQAAEKYRDAQQAVSDQLKTVYNAETDLLKKNYVSSLVWNKSKADVVKADADTEAASFAVASKQQDSARASLEASLISERIKSLNASPELMGKYTLKSPKAGYLTQCNAFQGQVVNPDTTLYQIFNPPDAFVIAFMDPSDAVRLKSGEQISLKVSGIAEPVTAQVDGFYPEYSGLPASLTRYFWEQEKWSQFEPVRFIFVGFDDAQQKALRASAQVSISMWRLPERGIYGRIARLISPPPAAQ